MRTRDGSRAGGGTGARVLSPQPEGVVSTGGGRHVTEPPQGRAGLAEQKGREHSTQAAHSHAHSQS